MSDVGEKLYILDQDKARIVVVGKKTGEYESQWRSDKLGGANDFVVDEAGKTIYFVAGQYIYEFEM